jgi:hypothetical protein
MISVNPNATSGGNRDSLAPAINSNGRLIAFHSEASNLVTSDPNDIVADIFVYNAQSGSKGLVSVDSAGLGTNAESGFPDISDDGQYVVFKSFATDMGSCTAGQGDIFVRDTVNLTNTCISTASDGGDANNESYSPVISGDGSTVVFSSLASNLVAGDGNGVADIFTRDPAAASATVRINLRYTGAETNTLSAFPSVSSDGRYVSFESDDADLVANDTNGARDVFVRDTNTANDIIRISVTATGTQADAASGLSRISADARYVSFDSNEALDAADTNGVGISDIYRGYNSTYP